MLPSSLSANVDIIARWLPIMLQNPDLYLIRNANEMILRAHRVRVSIFGAIKSQETCEQIVRSRKVQFPFDAAAFCCVICLPNIDWLELCALSPVVAAPSPGNHQFRTLSLNQRLLEAPYLRDLEPFRRKSLSQLNNNSSSLQSSNSNVPAIECGYKPNAPQIQGK